VFSLIGFRFSLGRDSYRVSVINTSEGGYFKWNGVSVNDVLKFSLFEGKIGTVLVDVFFEIADGSVIVW